MIDCELRADDKIFINMTGIDQTMEDFNGESTVDASGNFLE